MYGTLWGIILFKWRHFVCLSMVAILPPSLAAQEASAIMRSNGIGVLVNKQSAPSSTALFSGDLIETQPESVARIEASGSTADINPGTIVQFQVDELVLEHGSLSVNTSHGLRVRVGCVIVVPVNNAEWTHYDVADVDGKVSISALKNDVNIETKSSNVQQGKQPIESSRVSVREGEQKSREEKCAAAAMKDQGYAAAAGALMNSPWAIGSAVAVVVALTCIGLCHNDDPISPARP
jgi:hypothetical protein